jgi:Tfp pilus assembly protein PilF
MPSSRPAAVPQAGADAAETMARKVSALLAKANGYVENKQYDKAIATAENVLELDPGSTAAHAMISKAKTRQLEALRSGSTLE